MNKRNMFALIAILSLSLTLIIPTFSLTVLAKNMKSPPGANRVVYYDGGGNCSIPLPTTLPSNYPSSARNMSLHFAHVKIPNENIDFSRVIIMLNVTTNTNPKHHWEPFAIITTSSEDAAFLRTVWRGTFVYFDASLYPPGPVSTDNVIVVNENVLQVDRHGNTVNVNLVDPQPVKRITGPTFYIPEFSMTIDGYGDSIHFATTQYWTGSYLGASGYTQTNDAMGFFADGAFTSSAWNFNNVAVADALLTMHGTHTYYPPA